MKFELVDDGSDGRRVDCIAEDGRILFTIRAQLFGASITVRALQVCKVDGVLYGDQISVVPISATSVTVKALPYDEH